MKNGGIVTPIDPGLVARLAGTGPSQMQVGAVGQLDAEGRIIDNQTFFGPLNPLPPVAPPQVAGRQFDYRPGYNLEVLPRGEEALGFRDLRALADAYDLMRLVIETRKDQLVKEKWDIVRRDKKKATDPRADAAKDFFSYPDKEHSWDQWLRMLIEDQLVIDAATLYPRMDRKGALYSLDPVDGATIKRVLDDYGRTPMPPYPAYQQVLKGLPAIDYTREEILYLPRNLRTNRIYGFSPVEQVAMSVNIAIRRQLHQLQFYTEGTVPEAICGLPETWSQAQIREFQEYWDSLLADNTAERRHVRFVPGDVGKGFKQLKEADLKDDYDEWLARIVCYAFSVSPQWAVKQMNRATAETAKSQAQEEGLAPLQTWVKDVIDRVLARFMGMAEYEFKWIEEEAQDPQVQATIADHYLRNGTKSRNEVRSDLGLDPVPDGDVYLIYTASGAVTIDDVLAPPEPPPPPAQKVGPAGGGEGANNDDGSVGGAQKTQAEQQETMLKSYGPGHPSALQEIWQRFFDAAAAPIGAGLAELLGGTLTKAEGDADTPPPPVTEQEIEAAVAAVVEKADWAAVEAKSAGAIADQAMAGVASGIEAAAAADPALIPEFVASVGIQGETAAKAAIDITRLANPEAVAWSHAHSAELVSNVEAATKNELRALVKQAVTEGWTRDQLEAEILKAHAFSPVRAGLIARMEISNALNRGNLISWQTMAKATGARLLKRVVLGINENHCVVCLGNARDGAIPLDQEFSSGQLCPTFHVKCWCSMRVSADRSKPAAEPAAETLAKGFEDQPRDALGRWTAGAQQAEIEKGRAAMRKVIDERRSSDGHAMHVEGVGGVTFVHGWEGHPPEHGNGWGVAKIVAKHGDKAAMAVPETLVRGARHQDGDRMRFTHNGHVALLARGGNGPPDHWVLTAFHRD